MTNVVHTPTSYEPLDIQEPANDIMPHYRVRGVIQAPPVPPRASNGALRTVAGVLWVGVLVLWMVV